MSDEKFVDPRLQAKEAVFQQLHLSTFDTMGYAGYAPGANSRMPDKLTPLQQAMRQLPLEQAAETLAIIEKLTRNVVRNPSEDKFRKINLTNAKIIQVIVQVPNAIELSKVACILCTNRVTQ